MQLNPIPNVPQSDVYFMKYVFSIVAVLAIILIIGTIITRKYTSYRRLTGKIFVAMGIIEIIPYIYSAIYVIMINHPHLLYNHWIFVFVLGCITLTGGVALLKKIKHHWTFFLIMAAIIVITWTYSVWTFSFGLR